jgi:hypothetical protein
VKDIQEAAGVVELDCFEWPNGRAPNHRSTSVAVLRITRDGLPFSPPDARE